MASDDSFQDSPSEKGGSDESPFVEGSTGKSNSDDTEDDDKTFKADQNRKKVDDDKETDEDNAEVETMTSNKQLKKPEVLAMLKAGILYAGHPPPERNCTAKAWKEGGMRFLFMADTDEVLPDWYHCIICEWTHTLNLSGGTAVIKNHAEKHLYSFHTGDMIELLSKAIKFGHEHGSVTEQILSEFLMTSEKW